MKKVIVLVMITTIVLLIFIAVGLAKPVYHDVGKEEITDFWAWNQCTDEWIKFNGTVHYNVQLVIDSAGGYHWKWHANHNLTGVAADGKKYQDISTFTMHYNTKDGSAYEWTFINTTPLISQGKETNMIFKIRNQVTINANGEMTVSFSEIGFVCPGEKP
jgi:hypothetical protein